MRKKTYFQKLKERIRTGRSRVLERKKCENPDCDIIFPVYPTNRNQKTCSKKCAAVVRELSRRGTRKAGKKQSARNQRPEHVENYCHQDWDECGVYSDCLGKNFTGDCYQDPNRPNLPYTSNVAALSVNRDKRRGG